MNGFAWRRLFIFCLLALCLHVNFLHAQESEEEKVEAASTEVPTDIGTPATGDSEPRKLDPEMIEAIMKGVSDECKEEMNSAMMKSKEGEKPEISSKCQEEVAAAAQKKIKKDKRDKRASGGEKKKKKRSSKHKKDKTGILAIILGFITAAVVGLLGACYLINSKLTKAGLYDKPEKKLSKKKLDKKRRQASRNAPTAE